MPKAKVTLLLGLSMAKGRFRFKQGVPVEVTDPALISECKSDGHFEVHILPDETPAQVKASGEVGAAKAAPVSPGPAPAQKVRVRNKVEAAHEASSV